MSVVLKMKYPNGCKECELLAEDDGDYYCFLGCKIFGGRSNVPNYRIDKCPIIGEIPDIHGDLIDKDDVKAKMIPLDFSVQNWISEVDLAFVRTILKKGKE